MLPMHLGQALPVSTSCQALGWAGHMRATGEALSECESPRLQAGTEAASTSVETCREQAHSGQGWEGALVCGVSGSMLGRL